VPGIGAVGVDGVSGRDLDPEHRARHRRGHVAVPRMRPLAGPERVGAPQDEGVPAMAHLHLVRGHQHGALVDEPVDLQPVHAGLGGDRADHVLVHRVRADRQHPIGTLDDQLDGDRRRGPAQPPPVPGAEGSRAASRGA